MFQPSACSPQEVVRQSILTNQIPRAQAVLRRLSRPEQRLPALKMEGLRQVFSCLQGRDLQTASALLTNMVRTPPRVSTTHNLLGLKCENKKNLQQSSFSMS